MLPSLPNLPPWEALLLKNLDCLFSREKLSSWVFGCPVSFTKTICRNSLSCKAFHCRKKFQVQLLVAALKEKEKECQTKLDVPIAENLFHMMIWIQEKPNVVLFQILLLAQRKLISFVKNARRKSDLQQTKIFR